MKQGILLVIFGHNSYGKWAYNLAHSIKHYSDIPIHIVCEESTVAGLDMAIFDTIQYTTFETTPSGKYDVAEIKTSLIKYSPFEKTIYLDADGVALKDIAPLFDAIFKSHSVYSQAISAGKKTDSLNYTWASNDTLWGHFDLKEDAVYPSIQSSLIAFDKSKQAKEFFKKLKENYANPVDLKAQNFTWGNSQSQPDELYYGATFAQMGITPALELQPVFFPHTHTNKLTEIVNNHYLMAMYGANNLVKPFAKDFYDRQMHMVMRRGGKNHYFKVHQLYKNKFAGNKPVR